MSRKPLARVWLNSTPILVVSQAGQRSTAVQIMSRRCTQLILSILSAFSVHEKYSPLLCKCTQSVPAIEMQT